MQHTTLTPGDLAFVVSRIPQDIRLLMTGGTTEVFLAGGFIRATIAGERVSDIDLFGPDPMRAEHIMTGLALARKGRVVKTENAITVLAPPRHPVQFITRWTFDDHHHLVESFDYTVARAAVWYFAGTWSSACDARFYPDLAGRRLVYCAPVRDEDSGGSMMRARKFLAKGYSIQAPSLAGVVARLLKGMDPALLADEPALARAIMRRLREVDPLTIVDGCEVLDEHAVNDELPGQEGEVA